MGNSEQVGFSGETQPASGKNLSEMHNSLGAISTTMEFGHAKSCVDGDETGCSSTTSESEKGDDDDDNGDDDEGNEDESEDTNGEEKTSVSVGFFSWGAHIISSLWNYT